MAVPELQLSTSWVDFGTCFVDEEWVREVNLMNLSGCRSYWAVLMGRLCLPTTSPTAMGTTWASCIDGRSPKPR